MENSSKRKPKKVTATANVFKLHRKFWYRQGVGCGLLVLIRTTRIMFEENDS
jgi:hypothetical protein